MNFEEEQRHGARIADPVCFFFFLLWVKPTLTNLSLQGSSRRQKISRRGSRPGLPADCIRRISTVESRTFRKVPPTSHTAFQGQIDQGVLKYFLRFSPTRSLPPSPGQALCWSQVCKLSWAPYIHMPFLAATSQTHTNYHLRDWDLQAQVLTGTCHSWRSMEMTNI